MQKLESFLSNVGNYFYNLSKLNTLSGYMNQANLDLSQMKLMILGVSNWITSFNERLIAIEDHLNKKTAKKKVEPITKTPSKRGRPSKKLTNK